MKYLLLALMLLIRTSTATAQIIQTHTVSGTLADARSGEALQNAVVATEDGKHGTVTNSYGYFSLTLPAAPVNLQLSYTGYSTDRRAIDLSAGDVNFGRITLVPSAANELKEIRVSAAKSRLRQHVERTQMGLVDLPVTLLTKVPSIAGEPDIIKALQLTPGVKRGAEGTIGMYVRGGNVDENLVILDEATVYNAGHLLGFFSVFNTTALKDAELYKSSFPAQYGGRLSSIMDVRMKEGNKEHFQVDGSLGFISSALTVQGPLDKGKTSFIVSGRRSFLDFVAPATVPYHFYDVNAKINYIIDPANRVYLSMYKGDDVLLIKDKVEDTSTKAYLDLRSGLKLGNTVGSVRWNHIFGDPRLFSNLSLIYTKFRYNIEGEFGDNSLYIASSIRDIGARADLSFKPSWQHDLHFGGQLINHFFNPNIVNTSGIIPHSVKDLPGQEIYNTEFGAYASDEYKASDKITLNVGLRLTGDVVTGKTYFFPEPRIAGRYLIDDRSSVKASYAQMVQYMHLVASSAIALPTDLWYPVTERIAPGVSDQVSAGYFRSLPKLNVSLSVEAYYKWMRNQIEYREGATLVLNDDYEKELVKGRGRSYGVELFATKTAGRFQGWIGYTLSYAYRQFDSLNGGTEYFARYDRRHDVSVVATYELSKRWSFAGNYLYSSGSPFTAQISQYIAPNPTFTSIEVLPVYASRNATRFSGAQRIDLDIAYKFSIAKKVKSDIHIGCYNLLNAAQPGRVTRELNGNTGRFEYVQRGFFGFIPSLAINVHY